MASMRAPASRVSSPTASPRQLAEAWVRNGGDPKQTVVAVAVALAESGGRIRAINKNTDGSTDYGPWQVNSIHGYPPSQLLTLDGNAAAAVSIWRGSKRAKSGDGSGWFPWVTYKTGAYKPHIDSAKNATEGGGFLDAVKKGAIGAIPGVGPLAGLADAADVDVPNPLKWTDELAHLLGQLDEAEFWKHVGFILAGFIMLAFGLFFIGKELATNFSPAGILAKSVFTSKK